MKAFTTKKLIPVAGIMILAAGTIALAEAFGPVGHAMHEMEGALQCLRGTLPAFMCGGNNLADLANGSKDARAALLGSNSDADSRIKLNGLFDRLDAAIAQYGKATAEQNGAEQKAAMAAIVAVMNEGHAAFRKAPGT